MKPRARIDLIFFCILLAIFLAAGWIGMAAASKPALQQDANQLTGQVFVPLTSTTPVAISDTFTLLEDVPSILDVLGNDEVGDGPITITVVMTASHGVAEVHGTQLNFRPEADYFGNDQFKYQVENGAGEKAAAGVSLTILPVNDWPTISAPEFITVPISKVVLSGISSGAANEITQSLIVTATASSDWLTPTIEYQSPASTADLYLEHRTQTPDARTNLTLFVSDGISTTQQVLTVTVRDTRMWLPVMAKGFGIFNGYFDRGATGWAASAGPFEEHGSGLTWKIDNFNIVSDSGNGLRLGDPTGKDGALPVGFVTFSQTFAVPLDWTKLKFDYQVHTFDQIKGSNTSSYFDSFEVSLWEAGKVGGVTDEQRNALCQLAAINPTGEKTVVQPGLILCGGNLAGKTGVYHTFSGSVSFELQMFKGKSVILNFTLWSKEYNARFYNNRAYFNTWILLDNVRLEP